MVSVLINKHYSAGGEGLFLVKDYEGTRIKIFLYARINYNKLQYSGEKMFISIS